MAYGEEALIHSGKTIEFYHLVSGKTVIFPAFLTQFEDQFSSEWNEETVFGRMDPISTFKRTGRKINLGFDIVAGTVGDSRSYMGKIQTLIQMLYPSYDSGNDVTNSSTHISGPPLIRIKFMNLIRDLDGRGLVGYINGFNTSPVLENGFIEEGGNIYPKSYTVACTFTVLHTHKLGWYGSEDERAFADTGAGANYPYGSSDPGYSDNPDQARLRAGGASIEQIQEADDQAERENQSANAREFTGGGGGAAPVYMDD